MLIRNALALVKHDGGKSFAMVYLLVQLGTGITKGSGSSTRSAVLITVSYMLMSDSK